MPTTLFARDSLLWSVLFYVGMILNVLVAFVTNPADYGFSPVVWRWVILINAIVTAIAGKLGMSPVELARNQQNPKD